MSTKSPRIRFEKVRNKGLAIDVSVWNRSGTSTAGQIIIKEWPKKERVLRAIKYFFGCLGFGILSILLPFVHWVSVPLLILLSPLFGIFALTQKSKILGGVGSCPFCHQDFYIEAGPLSFPVSDICEGCKNTVEIKRP